MKTEQFKILAPIAILLGAILIATLLVLSKPAAEQKHSTPIQPLVDIVVAEKRTVAIPVSAQGTVRARTETQLIADIAGRVQSISDRFRVGGYFERGQEMARIDNRMYVAAVKRAQAAVAGANSALATEKGRSEVAHKEWQQRGKKTKRSEAALALYLRKPQLEEAKAKLASAKADLRQAQADLEHTVVRAPYDAMVKSQSIDLGQYLNQGTMMGSVFAIDTAEVNVPLPEKELQFVRIPDAFDQTEAIYPKVILRGTGSQSALQWQGRLIRTEGVLDEKTRSMTAVVEVTDPYGLLGNSAHREQPLRMGTYVNASIDGKPIAGLIEISQAAINPGNKIWLVNQHGRLEQRTVDILTRTAETAYVKGGLAHGDKVSTTSLSSFVTGAEVRIASINGEAPEQSLTLSPASANEAAVAQPQ
ncbi:MAG: efflux RND transporter periplasmic adaptor subunit [Pseudomonadales bacterium]